MTTETRSFAPARVYFEDVAEGQELPPLVNDPVTHTMLVRYCGASGDFNPLHTDPQVGLSMGIGGAIAHGMLIKGFLGRFISDYLGGPGGLRRFGVRFKSMTRPGDVITCTGYITRKYSDGGRHYIEASVQAAGPDGDVKAAGSFLAELPKVASQ